MRVVIFWTMCHHSLGHEKKALLISNHTVFFSFNLKLICRSGSCNFSFLKYLLAQINSKLSKQTTHQQHSLFLAKFISTFEDTKYKSWKIKRNKPLCHLPCREERQKQGGWVGEKLHEVEKQCDRFESDRN